MTVPSTEELQQLLDAATPGEWYLHEDEMGDPDGTYLHDTKDVMCIAITPIGSGSDYRENDLDLAALAPVLAAEVIRLREENERMKERVNKHAQDALRLTKYLHDHHPAVSAEFKSNLTRILEGDQA